MTALFLRNIQPEQYQPAHTAQLSELVHQGTGVAGALMVLPLALAGDRRGNAAAPSEE